MADFAQELRDRRIVPAVGVYAGGCWALIEVLDWLVNRYFLSPYITEIAFWGLLSLIPAVILITWTHGRPGKDRHTKAEKVGVIANIVITLGFLFIFFGDKNLSAVAMEVTVTNEEGVQQSHFIPNDYFRRRVAIFFFDNDSGDSELDWLQYGVTSLLVEKLGQNPFVSARSPWTNGSNGFYYRMQRAGFKDGLGIPRTLMQEIADDANRQFFLEGSIARVADEYNVTVRIWETFSLRQASEFTESGLDIYNIIETLALEIQDSLGIPKASRRIAEDIPIAETYGESTAAFKNYVNGLNARLFDNDIEASNALFDEALKEDPGFVLAWFHKIDNYLAAGDLASSQIAVRKAQELDYRLPAIDRDILKFYYYRWSGQQEKLIKFLRMQVQLLDDALSHYRLAQTLKVTGQSEEAKSSYLEVLARDPLNLDVYLQLANLERAIGNLEMAIEYVKRYQAEKPEDMEANLVLGDLLRDSGELNAAEDQYLLASLLELQRVQPMLRLVDVALRKGDISAAQELLEQAEEIAQAPLDKGLVRQTASLLEFRLGKIKASIKQLYRLMEYWEQSVPPFTLVISTYTPMASQYVRIGDTESAEAVLMEGRGMLSPPMDQFLAFSEVEILLEKNDLSNAEAALEKGVAIFEQFELGDLMAHIDFWRSHIQRKRGDFATSAESLQLALDQINRSTFAAEFSTLVPEIYALLVETLILNNSLEESETALAQGFRLDPSNPMLWVCKAQLQLASDLPQLAETSINQALSIWKDADPEYREYIRARELLKEIQEVL